MMNCIIVDDEPLAREILEEYIGRLSFLHLKGSCKNAFETIELLKKEEVDLIFLDIQMPDFTGMQLYKTLKKKPMVIFTTAYSEHAVEGFEVDAVDYLVKPFSFERFIKAVNKAANLKEMSDTVQSRQNETIESEFIFVKDGNKTIKINLDDILYLEGMKDYVKIVLRDKYILSLISMQKMSERLPESRFMRVHRSYIVPFSKINHIERNRLVIGETWIPIGKNYRDEFFKRIKF
jgi:DNA-binding LytR/AlgR family response regulator